MPEKAAPRETVAGTTVEWVERETRYELSWREDGERVVATPTGDAGDGAVRIGFAPGDLAGFVDAGEFEPVDADSEDLTAALREVEP